MMTLNKRMMALVALVLVLLAVAIVFGRSGPAAPATAPAAMTPTVPSVANPSVSGGAPSRPSEGVPPPWAAGGVQSPSVALPGQALGGPLVSAASAAAAQRDFQELEKMQQELADSMRGGQQPDPKRVEALLNQLKQKHGSTVAGVNLDVVISNLQVAQEIQVLALDMQRESAKPGGGDIKKVQVYVEQLTKLQSRLRTDVSAPQVQPAAK